MKFLHLGDLHIGKSLGEFDLYSDQAYILNQILDIVREKEIDAVLIAGDVYDKAVPSEAAVRLLDHFLRNLAEAQVKTYLISGNHDSDDRLNFGSSLFEANGIFITSKFEGKLSKKVVKDDFGEVNIYLLPFVKASQVRHFFPKGNHQGEPLQTDSQEESCEMIETYHDAVRIILKHTDIDRSARNILVAHQFVAGKEEPHMAGSEGLAVQNVGLVEQIGYDLFEDFDYVALGHIHSPQKIGREQIRYSGSPLKYSLSEVHNEKSVPVITIGEKGDVDIELVPLNPMRDLRHIRGNLKQLLDPANITDSDDFIYATLTDESIVNDAMAIFQQYYPNTVKIDYDNSHTREIEKVDFSNITEDKAFSELIADFYRLIYSCEISEEEMAVLEDVAKEAGVNI